MGLIERSVLQTSIARDTDANDTPGATRVAHYLDSTGARTGKWAREMRLYNATGGALTKNAVYMLNYTGVPSTSPQVIACATSTPTRQLVVAKEAVAIASWGWFAVAGWTDALVDGTTDVAISDFLKLTSGTSATAFIKDGTTITTSSHAIAGAASTADSANTTLIELLGDRALVA
jgi:hypothetical protein